MAPASNSGAASKLTSATLLQHELERETLEAVCHGAVRRCADGVSTKGPRQSP